MIPVLYCVALKRAETLHCCTNDRFHVCGKIWCDETEIGQLQRIGLDLLGPYFTVSPSKDVFRRLVCALPELQYPRLYHGYSPPQRHNQLLTILEPLRKANVLYASTNGFSMARRVKSQYVATTGQTAKLPKSNPTWSLRMTDLHPYE